MELMGRFEIIVLNDTAYMNINNKLHVVQSVIFDNKMYTIDDAKFLLKANDLKCKKIDITKNYIRFRQEDPKDLHKMGLYNVKTIQTLLDGVKLIVYY